MTLDTATYAPCPFCGCLELRHAKAFAKRLTTYWVECRECLAQGPTEFDKGLVRGAWNRRV